MKRGAAADPQLVAAQRIVELGAEQMADCMAQLVELERAEPVADVAAAEILRRAERPRPGVDIVLVTGVAAAGGQKRAAAELEVHVLDELALGEDLPAGGDARRGARRDQRV